MARTSSGTQPATPPATSNRSTIPTSDRFTTFISQGWAEQPDVAPAPRDQAGFAAARRGTLSQRFPGKRLIIPAGGSKTRSNDTDYAYRAHSGFSHLTGWASDTVPGSVLVLEPTEHGHEATLYLRASAGRDSSEFYANPEIGEFWIGPRPSLAHVAADLGLATADLADFAAILDAVDPDTLVVRDADQELTDSIDGRRLLDAEVSDTELPGADSFDADSLGTAGDADLARELSELRLVKDAYEIEQMRRAVAVTKRGFDDIVDDLPAIAAHERGERLVEGTFNRRARAEGNAVGYDTIAASGPHACILHWTRND